MFENDPAIKAGLVDENGVEIDRSDAYKSGKDAVRRNACMQFVHDIGSTPIHPNSTLRTRWDLMILMLLVYVCITAPVMVCFEITLDRWGGLWWWENVVNAIFVVDIFLNMNTAFYGRPAMLCHVLDPVPAPPFDAEHHTDAAFLYSC